MYVVPCLQHAVLEFLKQWPSIFRVDCYCYLPQIGVRCGGSDMDTCALGWIEQVNICHTLNDIWILEGFFFFRANLMSCDPVVVIIKGKILQVHNGRGHKER
jgi:hypothetical protein